MSDYIFLFDLDSTITRQEVVPVISEFVGKGAAEEMRRITEDTMQGKIPFRESLIQRVSILCRVDVKRVRERVARMSLNEELLKFIQTHKERCFIVTGNLDAWIGDLIARMGMEGHVFCSRTRVRDGKVQLVSIVDKGLVAQQMAAPFVAVGDGSNDAPMVALADVGIGFGGVRPVAPVLAKAADFQFDDEHKLVTFLKTLL